jgi:signal peptidase I
MDFSAEKIVKAHEKLMKRSNYLIISFFLFFVLDTILFIFLQSNKLFMFSLSRTAENIPNAFLNDIFQTVFYLIILLSVIFYIVFLILYLKKYYKYNYKVYKAFHTITDLFNIVPIFLFFIILLNGFFFSVALVDGDSMKPTFMSQDTVLIGLRSEITNDDVVIVLNEDTFLVKRLVASAGDELLVDETGVWVNGVLIENYMPTGSIHYEKTLLEGEYYVLGDNRQHSLDSRLFGIVEAENILGEVIYNLSGNN